jgi:hypothetical protein
MIHKRSWKMLPKMLPFVASQAVAVSQAKRDASKALANGQPSATRRTGKGFFATLLGALFESRKRQAIMEILRRGRWRAETLGK